MRDIKFRAWHEGNKCFVYATIKDMWINGWHCAEGHYGGENHEYRLNKPTPKSEDGVYTTEEYLEKSNAFKPNAHWLQYTGLKDKNGKEIYESDIIEDTRGEFMWRYLVKWSDKGAWIAYANKGYKQGRRSSTDKELTSKWHWEQMAEFFYNKGFNYCQIIGNLCENPELLSERVEQT